MPAGRYPYRGPMGIYATYTAQCGKCQNSIEGFDRPSDAIDSVTQDGWLVTADNCYCLQCVVVRKVQEITFTDDYAVIAYRLSDGSELLVKVTDDVLGLDTVDASTLSEIKRRWCDLRAATGLSGSPFPVDVFVRKARPSEIKAWFADEE